MSAAQLTAPKPRWLGLLPDLVVKNVIALYGVQISRKVIPLASVPYLARVLGPAGWGEVAFVTALAELIAMLIEFGFTLSATRSIARHRDDALERGRIATGVLCTQTLLAAGCVAVALLVSPHISLLRGHPALLAAGLAYAVAQGFVPLWYFQGMERLRLLATIEISAKASALLVLFIFVKGPQDVWRAVAIQAISPAVCVFLGIRLALRTSSVCRPRRRLLNAVFKESWDMFMFRSAESIYGVANAFLLGLFASPAIVGYFSSAEKISKATAGLVNPIRESLYPRVSSLTQRDRPEGMRLAKTGAIIMVSLGGVLSAALFLLAGRTIAILMGGRFEPAVRVLQILSPLPLLIAVTFSCGQLFLFPLQKDRTALRAVIRSAAINLCLSCLLSPRWGHTGMALAVLVSEAAVAGSLLWNVVRVLPGSAAPIPNAV